MVRPPSKEPLPKDEGTRVTDRSQLPPAPQGQDPDRKMDSRAYPAVPLGPGTEDLISRFPVEAVVEAVHGVEPGPVFVMQRFQLSRKAMELLAGADPEAVERAARAMLHRQASLEAEAFRSVLFEDYPRGAPDDGSAEGGMAHGTTQCVPDEADRRGPCQNAVPWRAGYPPMPSPDRTFTFPASW